MGVFEGAWCSNEVGGTHGIRVWKNIRSGWGDVAQHISFVVGDGSRISLWQDSWCGGRALKVAFLGLFRIAYNASVADVLDYLCHASYPGVIHFNLKSTKYKI